MFSIRFPSLTPSFKENLFIQLYEILSPKL